jgi:hypothetical protein
MIKYIYLQGNPLIHKSINYSLTLIDSGISIISIFDIAYSKRFHKPLRASVIN